MKAIFALAALVAVIAYADAKAAHIQEEHPINWYDCSQKKDGNYVHPTDCTRFISCSGGIASQRDCANCDTPGRCIRGRTVYNSTVDACLWADQTRCEEGDDGTTEPPSTDPPATAEPTQAPTNAPTQAPTDSPSEETDSPSTPDSNETTPSDDDQQSTTEGQETRPPQEGDPCNPDECRNEGYCQSYLRCDKETGKLVGEECGENLVWNPRNPNGTNQVHGGNCDTWENLDADIVQKYRNDPNCLGCFWRALGDCNQQYEYQAPNGTHRNVLTLSCTDGLVFSLQKETCQRCQDVQRTDGTGACCQA